MAIELAAARVGVLGVEQIAARLDNRFHLLTGGGRMTLPRHRTLAAAIDWSYLLLSEVECMVLRWISIFTGGWTLEAAESICASDKIDSKDILDLLTQLVNKSLVVVDQGATRYHLLETIREYALKKLDEAGETEAVGNRHLEYYLQMADAAEPGLLSLESTAWMRRLFKENDNLRSALTRAFASGQLEIACRITIDLHWFWIQHSMINEAVNWLERALALRGSLRNEKLQAQVLGASGEVLLWVPDFNSARQRFEESLAIFREIGDKKYIVWETIRLGIAFTYLEDSRGLTLLEESVALARQAGDKFVLGSALLCLGECWRLLKDDAKAVACYEESLRWARGSSPAFQLCAALDNFANVALHQGKIQQAENLILESLTLSKEANMDLDMLYALIPMGGVAIALGRYERAARLLGAVAGALQFFGIELQPTDRADWERNITDVRTKLSTATFNAAWNEGCALTLEEAVNYALKRET